MNQPEAPFAEPWQAQLFAFTVALNESGLFSWEEWTGLFGPKVQSAPDDAYWETWSDALAELLANLGILTIQELQMLTRRWQAAARATPHGQAIELSASPH